jgi:hypothetical protein
MEVPTLVAVKALPKYRIWLRYSDGAAGEVDLSYLAGKGVFKLWDDYQSFEKVYVSDAGAIAWSDAVEICPDATYIRLTGKSVDELSLHRDELLDRWHNAENNQELLKIQPLQ